MGKRYYQSMTNEISEPANVTSPAELETPASGTETDPIDTQSNASTGGPADPEPWAGVVHGALWVRVRKQPSLDSEVLKVLQPGDPVTVLKTSGDFYKTQFGYVHQDYVKEV